MKEKEEGWYLDPYGLHQARWFSGGSPTALVRDNDRESRDARPGRDYDRPLVPLTGVPRPDDLRRADDAERSADQTKDAAEICDKVHTID